MAMVFALPFVYQFGKFTKFCSSPFVSVVFAPQLTDLCDCHRLQIYVALCCVALLTASGNLLAHNSRAFADYDLQRWWWIMFGIAAAGSLLLGSVYIYVLRQRWKREVWCVYLLQD